MQKNRIETAGSVELEHESNSTIQYVYRYAVVAGRGSWKWQQKGTFVWATANTEREAIDRIKEDAAKRGSAPSISDISLFRPRPEQLLEIPEASQRLRETATRDGVNRARAVATNALGTSVRIVEADTGSGVYRGAVIGETEHYVLQRQSMRTAVLHPKQLLDRRPKTGENVSINYSNARGLVRQARSPAKAQELGR